MSKESFIDYIAFVGSVYEALSDETEAETYAEEHGKEEMYKKFPHIAPLHKIGMEYFSRFAGCFHEEREREVEPFFGEWAFESEPLFIFCTYLNDFKKVKNKINFDLKMIDEAMQNNEGQRIEHIKNALAREALETAEKYNINTQLLSDNAKAMRFEPLHTPIHGSTARPDKLEVLGKMAVVQYINRNCKGYLMGIDKQEPRQKTAQMIKNTLNKTELSELVKALCSTGKIQSTETETLNVLASVFDLDLTYNEHTRKLMKIKSRNLGNETSFINSLKDSLLHWISKEK